MAEQDPFAAVTTTSAKAIELLRDLADEENQERLKKDPAAFFREYGVAFSAELLPSSGELMLPSAEELRDLADALEEGGLDPGADYSRYMLHPFMFSVHPWIGIVASIANRRSQAS